VIEVKEEDQSASVREMEGRGECTLGLEDTENFVTSDEADLGDAVGVTEGDADLGRSETLPGEFDDVVDDILRCCLEPRGRSAAVGQGRGR